MEESLVFESAKDFDSIARFSLVCDELCGGECFADVDAVSPPAGVLVFRPASLTQSSDDELVDFATVVVAIGSELDKVESYCRS